MRDFINITQMLFEGEKSSIPTADLIAIAHEIHHSEQDFNEGDLENRIWKFTKYVLMSLPIDTIDARWATDDELVADYTSRLQKGETPPPIIYDAVDESLIDGTHRVMAAKAAGAQSISAYVGLEENLDPYWDEHLDETIELDEYKVINHTESDDASLSKDMLDFFKRHITRNPKVIANIAGIAISTATPWPLPQGHPMPLFFFIKDDQPVGFAMLNRRSVSDIETYNIGLIYLTEAVRGTGLGIGFYKLLLNSGIWLVSDDTLTANSMRIWQKITDMPEYSVRIVTGARMGENTGRSHGGQIGAGITNVSKLAGTPYKMIARLI